MQYAIIAAFLASLLWGIEDALSKKPVDKLGISRTNSIALVVGLLPLAIVAAFYPVHMTNAEIFISVLSGIFWGAGFMLVYKSVSTENVTTTYALNEIYPAIIIIFGILGLGEKVSTINTILIIAIFLGALLVMVGGNLRLNMRLLYAVLANISWGIFWILIISVIHANGNFAVPLLIARVMAAISVILFFAVFSGRHRSNTPQSKLPAAYLFSAPVLIAAFLGVIDAIGNDAMGFVSTTNFITIGGGIIATSPIFIALIGRFLYRDRLLLIQWAGFVVMVVAAAILALF